MRKILIRVLKILAITFAIIIAVFFLWRYKLESTDLKFESTELNISYKTMERNWGKPDSKYGCSVCDGDSVFMYNREFFGWYRYTFVFDSKKDILVFKTVDE